MSLKSQLSHLMPVVEACNILGEDLVSRIVSCLIELQQRTAVVRDDSRSRTMNDNKDIAEDTSFLIRAMMYRMNPQTPTSLDSNNETARQIRTSNLHHHIPPPIRDAWNKLSSPALMLDKLTLIKFLVPSCAQPHPGPGGHMGLFDCLTYALQTKNVQSSGGGNEPSLVGIPDIIIFLAICKQYSELKYNPKEDRLDNNNPSSDPNNKHPTAVIKMCQWMFLVYDGFKKNNMLLRDTLHRFLSDVYGENVYERHPQKRILDTIFSKATHLSSRDLQLTSREFINSVTETMTYSPYPTHFLLDWMAALAHAFVPPSQEPKTTTTFLQTIDQQVRWLPRILEQYELAEHRLYEIKRKFHSLVETSTEVIQGDPMNVEEAPSSSNTTNTIIVPKQSIHRAAFERAICTPSDELGHGGYLPVEIARKIFAYVGNMTATHGMEEEAIDAAKNVAQTQVFWDFTHVLQFGGICVRVVDEDVSLVRWILQLVGGKRATTLSKSQVAELIVLLCQHMQFRLNADQWHLDVETDDDAEAYDENNLDINAARKLDLVPEKWGAGNGKAERTVPTQILVDHLFQQVGSKDDILTFDQLLAWYNGAESKDEQRLGPFIKELRLICSVLFGVPPKLASMEESIINEITRRHKSRYPQTELSRRGPRGTVWYIIDDNWLLSWQAVVKKISFTPDDEKDLRDQASEGLSPRHLSKISNRKLLRDNASLALRVDIKWRSEYEIIPPLAWSALQAWYDGGPPLYRTVVPYVPSSSADGKANTIKTENEIELYPFFVKMFLCDASSKGEARPFQQGVPVSRVNPVQTLLIRLCKGLDISVNMARLWVMDSIASASFTGEESKSGEGEWLLEKDQNIVEQRKKRMGENASSSNFALLLEVKDEESGLWPRGINGKEWSFSKNDPDSTENGDGIVGLYNMGNTCYLNASIQCLSHTPIFRDYFNSKCYLNDINTTNPLGHEGRLAQVSAVLINKLWERFNQHVAHQPKRVIAPGSYAPVNAPALTPKTFKESLGKFNEHFAGNEQHDAQELLAFLLGGLSEDLNRIQDKPYIQAPDSDGRPDHELADIWWSNHLKREMSIIVALFTGQYKSLLKCKSCKYESARFEPFTFLQVPLPEDDTIPISLTFYPKEEGEDAVKYSLRVHNNGTLYDVLIALAKTLYTDEQESVNDDGGEGEVTDTQTEVKEEELEAKYADLARNMAVVDMRDGYISKIAPVSRTVPDLNPCMRVFAHIEIHPKRIHGACQIYMAKTQEKYLRFMFILWILYPRC